MILGELTWFCCQEFKLDQVRDQLQVWHAYQSSPFVVEV